MGTFGKARDARLGGIERLQHLPGIVVEHPADLGRGDRPGRSIEQPDAEMVLQLLDPLAGNGRRQSEIAAAGGDAAEIHDPDENAQALDIGHGRSPQIALISTRRADIFNGSLKEFAVWARFHR